MIEKFYYKTHLYKNVLRFLEPFFARLPSKFRKSAKMCNFFSKLQQQGIQYSSDLEILIKRGIGNLATVRRLFRTVAIYVCVIFNVTVVFSSKYYRFLQCSGSMTFWCGSGSADPCL
jgi:hypothetical protein